MSRRIPWVEKYRPRRLSEVVNQEEAKKALLDWINDWEKGKPSKKAVMLVGPPGTGKTTLAYALANERGYEVLELNASDVRTGERIRQVMGGSMKMGSLFGFKGRIILFDEVDGLNVREDRGGLAAIVELIRESTWPIIMTANNPWDPKFRELRDEAEVIQLKPLDEDDILTILRRICNAEGIKCEEDALKLIAESSGGDVRAAINDLQAAAEGKKVLTKDDVTVTERAHQFDMFKILDKVFHARRFEEARSVTFLPSFDWESYYPWALDNIPSVYAKSVEAVSEALDNLSLSDVVRGRIMKTQEWELMPYMLELMTAGVALVRNKPALARFVRLTFPERIRLLAKTKEIRQMRDALINRLRTELHVSSSEVSLYYMPLLRLMATSDAFKKKLLERLMKIMGYSLESVEKTLGIEEVSAGGEGEGTKRGSTKRSRG
ncbi:replication factor C large subunit [Vulcanisaeta distributa]|uniref:Replication factor C large subunit n=1 Tax=Vulcanisaeta distributa (strain DSM 14429 / JCM 11212 / NBRC 100878 / IC-017) TaxID=572478 RepID=E1QQC0_VULDI|nr:replication factor C large subunit [Vulcanisaeta distributa]ADN51607.1 AAA ATPase central domain protein [Vulcanisaeta distributa DSM 14429]